MEPDSTTVFQESKVKLWLAAQVAGIVVWLALASAMAVVGVGAPVQVAVLVVAAFGFSSFVDPRRRWWGTGPSRIMDDPAARGRYRRLMIAWLVGVLGLAFVVVTFIVAAGIVEPAGAAGQ